MKLSKLGNSDLMLSRVGMGTWAIGGGDWGMGWGDQDEKESVLAIIEALEQGINWIDTAHAYGFGVSEEAVSKALREWKADEIIVATKCGVLPQEDGKPRRFISSVTIREEEALGSADAVLHLASTAGELRDEVSDRRGGKEGHPERLLEGGVVVVLSRCGEKKTLRCWRKYKSPPGVDLSSWTDLGQA